MVAIPSKKERSVKDMLSKPTAGKTEADNPLTGKHREEEMDEDTRAPVKRSFLEGLVALLQGDIQAVKRDMSEDLKVVRRELKEVGKRVVILEGHENTRDDVVVTLDNVLKTLLAFLEEVGAFWVVLGFRVNLSKSQALSLMLTRETVNELAQRYPFRWQGDSIPYLVIR
ncbi:hypothetical protein NDU88_002958 [Pleurodeles waltl]|uniref:Uncharacterized protein n=1 Tax=Pleurodeles waltl TaxID=8319 RepID=A0AAV7RFG5_PLEWA|nr:hypothetical protein NDU88_002958 [Pleurodeles waltl]